jgi:diadenosine tetraphosphate (Ap4A) HIT family hydrolase
MQEAAPVRVYACLVSRTHAVELHDLPEATACALMRDGRRVSSAVSAATNAVKVELRNSWELLASPAYAFLSSLSWRLL